jgi:tetratricopeptide (TPR) repeat protein
MQGRAARFYLQAIQTNEKYLPPYMNLGYLYLDRGDKQLAAEYFKERYDRAPQGDPRRGEAKEEFLRIRPESRDEFVNFEALQMNDQITAQRYQDFHQRVKQSQEYRRKGDKLLQRKKYREAIAAFDQALERTPENPKVLKARREAILELSKENIQGRSATGIMMRELGDSRCAKERNPKDARHNPR